MKNSATTVYVLRHTFQGTPESGEIHSIYSTQTAAESAMEKVLMDEYQVTVQENQDEDYVYMFISAAPYSA